MNRIGTIANHDMRLVSPFFDGFLLRFIRRERTCSLRVAYNGRRGRKTFRGAFQQTDKAFEVYVAISEEDSVFWFVIAAGERGGCCGSVGA